ncbi:unnamed protein product, partial [Staurois parvus]
QDKAFSSRKRKSNDQSLTEEDTSAPNTWPALFSFTFQSVLPVTHKRNLCITIPSGASFSCTLRSLWTRVPSLTSPFPFLSAVRSLLLFGLPFSFKGLLTYVACHPNPSNQAARILQRLTCDPLCLEAFIRTGSICTLRARLLLHESPGGDDKERSRHPERARKLGDILLRNLCIQAASPFGMGLVAHMLVSGPQSDRQQCALCLPFIYRKDSPHRQNLLDGAIHLVLESLMISVDPVYFFHASECLSSMLTPQTSECRSSVLTPQTSECRTSVLTPQTSECRTSVL